MSVRGVVSGLALAVVMALGACAEGIDAGERSGMPCETDDDCNAARTCGVRHLCVAGRCEVATQMDVGPSLLVPCGEASGEDDGGVAD